MKRVYRVILGRKNKYAELCRSENFVGVSFDVEGDLQGRLPDNWRKFNAIFVPELAKAHPDKSNISAGLQCGYFWTVAKGMTIGDFLLCPNGRGQYMVGEVAGDYEFSASGPLPHRRAVTWSDVLIEKSSMPMTLQRSCGSIGTVADVTKHGDAIDSLLRRQSAAKQDEEICDPETLKRQNSSFNLNTTRLSSVAD